MSRNYIIINKNMAYPQRLHSTFVSTTHFGSLGYGSLGLRATFWSLLKSVLEIRLLDGHTSFTSGTLSPSRSFWQGSPLPSPVRRVVLQRRQIILRVVGSMRVGLAIQETSRTKKVLNFTVLSQPPGTNFAICLRTFNVWNQFLWSLTIEITLRGIGHELAIILHIRDTILVVIAITGVTLATRVVIRERWMKRTSHNGAAVF